MDLDFAILADGVTPRPDGKLDIHGAGFDTVFAPSVPVQHPRLALAVRILLSRHETESVHWLDVVIQEADGAELARSRADLDPLSADARAQIPPGRQFGLGMVLNFENVVFTGLRRLSDRRAVGWERTATAAEALASRRSQWPNREWRASPHTPCTRWLVRGIDRDDVENVLADPECQGFSREPPYRYLYSRQIVGRRLLVVVEPDDRDCVVNAFWPPPKRRSK